MKVIFHESYVRYKNFHFSNRFDPSSTYSRAHTALNSTTSVPIHSVSSTEIRRSYIPMSSTTSNVLINTTTRKPRSYLSSATSIMKT